jgi:hypothetical protein
MASFATPDLDRSILSKEDLDLVRTRVDKLEIKAEEAKKPWYRQLPLWISILSLLISSGFSAYTAYQQSKEQKAAELKRRLENLRSTVLQIADIRNEFVIASTSAEPNMAQFTQRSALLNTKKQVLIENADALISGIETEVSPAIFAELAYEESADGKVEEARRYYELGLRSKHPDALTSGAIMRSLGELYMQPIAFHDNEKGRAYYREALRVQNGQDDASLSYRTYTLADWAYSEFINKNESDGQKYLQEARSTAAKITNAATQQQAMNNVTIATQYAGDGGQARLTISSGAKPTLIGQWHISYEDDANRAGIVTIVPAQDNKSMTVSVNIFQSGNLIKKYSGALYGANDGAMQVEWSGVQTTSSPAMPWMMVYGITSLHTTKDGNILGKESTVGDVTRVVRLHKAQRS